MLYGDCPNLPVQRATELYRDRGLVQGPCTFIVFATCSGVVDTAGADVGFRLASLPSSLDSCCVSRSIGHVRCSSFVLAALVGMER